MSLSAAVKTLLDEFVGVAPRSGSRIVALFEPKVYNLSTDTETTLRFSDSRYATGSADTPASTLWLPRFALPTFRSSLGFEQGMVGHAGTIKVGQISLVNPDGRLDDYLDESVYSFDGRDAEILLGGHDWDRADFSVLAAVKIIGVSANLETIRFDVEGQMLLDRTFASTLYGGFEAALECDGSTTYVEVGDEYDVGDGSFTLEFRCRWPNRTTLMAMVQKRNSFTTAGDAGWSAHMTSTDRLQFSVSDGTNSYDINAGDAGEYDDDAWHTVSYVIDRANDELLAYVDGVADATPVDITSLGTVRTSDVLRFARRSTAAAYFKDDLDEIRIYGVANSAGDIKATAGRALTGTEPGLIGLFNFDGYGLVDTGATTLNSVEGPTLQSVVFDASGEEISWGNNKDVTTGDHSFGIWFRPSSSDSTLSFLLGKKNTLIAGSAGYALYLNSSNAIGAQISDGTNLGARTDSSYDFRDGRWWAAVVTVDRTNDTLDLYYRPAGGSWSTATQLDISSVTGSLTNSDSLKSGRDGNNANQFLGQVSDAFYSPQHLTAQEAQDAMDFSWFPTDNEPTEPPAIDALTGSGGTGYWPMDENTGLTITDGVGSTNGTATLGTSWQDRDGDVTGGTWISSLEGGKSLVGSPKPICLGRVKDAPAMTISSVLERVVQFSTPELAASEEVEAARVDGLLMTLTTDYTVDLTNSTLTVDSALGDGSISVDVRGLQDSGGDWMFRTGDLAEWVVSDQIGATLEAGTVAALNTAYPYEVGLYLKSEEYLTREVLAALFQAGKEAQGSRGRIFWAELFGGDIRFGALKDLSGETEVLHLTDAFIADTADGISKQAMRPAAWKVLVGWQRVWTEFRDFLGAVSESEKERMSAKYRWAEESDAAVLTDHVGARVLKLPTMIYREADAKLEAITLFNLFSVPRPLYVVKAVRAMFQVEIGDTVKVTDDRLGLDSGKLFTCVGYSYDLGGPSRYPTSTLELWGGF